MISLRRPGIVAAGLASGLVAALVSTAGPVMAEQYTQVDSVRDVATYVYDLESGEETLSSSPADAATDIRRVRFDFRDHRLVIRATMRAGAARIRSVVQAKAAGDDYFLYSTRSGSIVVSTDDSEQRCRGGVATNRPKKATVRVVIPVSCLGDASSARFGFGVTRSVDRGPDKEATSVDDVGRTGFREDVENLKLGKRIRRG